MPGVGVRPGGCGGVWEPQQLPASLAQARWVHLGFQVAMRLVVGILQPQALRNGGDGHRLGRLSDVDIAGGGVLHLEGWHGCACGRRGRRHRRLDGGLQRRPRVSSHRHSGNCANHLPVLLSCWPRGSRSKCCRAAHGLPLLIRVARDSEMPDVIDQRQMRLGGVWVVGTAAPPRCVVTPPRNMPTRCSLSLGRRLCHGQVTTRHVSNQCTNTAISARAITLLLCPAIARQQLGLHHTATKRSRSRPSELEGQDVCGRKVEALRQDLPHVVFCEAPGNGPCIAPVVQHLPHLQGVVAGVGAGEQSGQGGQQQPRMQTRPAAVCAVTQTGAHVLMPAQRQSCAA